MIDDTETGVANMDRNIRVNPLGQIIHCAIQTSQVVDLAGVSLQSCKVREAQLGESSMADGGIDIQTLTLVLVGELFRE